MQKDGRNLKEASDELKINYSTAKTIVQTFRRERRIAKKSKKAFITKRGLRRERRLVRKVTKATVPRMLAKIISTATSLPENFQKPSLKTNEQSTAAIKENNGSEKAFSRVVSVSQIVFFPSQESGPKVGQVSRGVLVELQDLPKKNIFLVFHSKVEEGFKEVVDYNDLVPSKIKATGESIQLTKLPPLQLSPTHPLVEDVRVSFEFGEYKRRIEDSNEKRYV